MSALIEALGGSQLRRLGAGVRSVGEVGGFRVTIVSPRNLPRTPGEIPSQALDAIRNDLCVYAAGDETRAAEHRVTLEALGADAGCLLAFFAEDVEALDQGAASPGELIHFKLFRRLFLGKPDMAYSPVAFAEYEKIAASSEVHRAQPLAAVLSDLGEEFRSWVDHPSIAKTKEALDNAHCCILRGRSSSGKTILALQVGHAVELSHPDAVYADLSRAPGFDAELASIITRGVGGLLILDDLQSNPRLSRYLIALAHLIRRAGVSAGPDVLCVCWEDFAQQAWQWWPGCSVITVAAEQVGGELLARFSDVDSELRADLATRFLDDVLLLKLALQRASDTQSPINLADVAEQIWNARAGRLKSSPEAIRAGLLASVLGTYDIPTPESFLKVEAVVGDDLIEALESTRLLRRKDSALTPGHRSLCGLLASWLGGRTAWAMLQDVGGPGNAEGVLFDYLKSLSSSSTLNSLRALSARAGFRDQPELNTRAQALVRVWTAFESVVERVEELQDQDPLWGRTPSSAGFAAQVLSTVGEPEKAEPSIRFLRRHWSVERGQIEFDTRGLATTDDFVKIREAMQLEDDEAPDPTRTPAVDIDADRFHATWLSGLVLGAEAVAAEPVLPLKGLAHLVEATAIPSTGAFYPERVPWVTARVLLGLAACGRTLSTSSAVARAVEWLLRDRRYGGALSNGVWESGTDGWNSQLETTAMVLLALAHAGVDMDLPQVNRARRYLLEHRDAWTAPGNELDGTLAAQAFLDSGGEWYDVADAATQLSAWGQNQAFWRDATVSAKESLQQSCRVAQIAMHLVNIGWRGVQAQLPAFVDALAVPHETRKELLGLAREGDASRETAAVAGDSVQAVSQLLLPLSEVDVSALTVVGSYRRWDEVPRQELRDWAQRIEKSLLEKSGARENYLIWGLPGSGKTFLVDEVVRSLAPRVRPITMNLAKDTPEEIQESLSSITGSEGAVLCLLDEVDKASRGYADLFPWLDLNAETEFPTVFVLVGSLGESRVEMQRLIGERDGGKDLVSRVPAANRFEIPLTSVGDQVAVAVSAVLTAADRGTRIVDEVEKLGLFYMLTSDAAESLRQLSEAAQQAVRRMDPDDSRLRYDDFFRAGDRTNQGFFHENQELAKALANRFVRIRR